MQRSGLLTRALLGCAGLAALLPASAATAQQMDMEVYNRWAPVVVVHYVIVGVYENDSAAVSQMASGSTRAKAHVKDRFEIAFDWDQSELKIVGTPVIKNFPSTFDNFTAYAGCGTPRLTGTYEHVTYLSVTSEGTGHLTTQVKRDFVAAVVDGMGDEGRCGATSVSIPAESETGASMLLIVPPMYYAMPSSGGVTLSADKKSIIMPTQEGWTLTYTLTAVR